MTYYPDLINKIKEYIEDNKILMAKTVLDEEFKMPYIPKEYEEELLRLNDIVNSLIKLDEDIKETSIVKIEEYLYGDPPMQLQAVAALFEKNIRAHLDVVRKYLSSDPFPDAASLLIDSMIDQQINDQIEYIKDKISYTFIPSCLKKPHESAGFIKADECLKEWIANDNPSVYEMCLQLLIREAYLNLPLEYDWDEGVSLALSVLNKVLTLMDDLDTYDEIVKNYDLSKITLINLRG